MLGIPERKKSVLANPNNPHVIISRNNIFCFVNRAKPIHIRTILITTPPKKKKMSQLKINLGCGNDIKKGYINIDLFKRKGVTTHDLNKTPYPFKKNSVDEVLCLQTLEHLNISVPKFMEQIWRILKPNGTIVIEVPHFSSASAYWECHTKFFRYKSFQPDQTDTYSNKVYQNFFTQKKQYCSTKKYLCTN